jgi:hypothetical protein
VKNTEEGNAVSGSSSGSSGSEADGSDGAIEEEEEFDDVADVFESSYNFRFEEPCVVSLHYEGGN